MIGVRGKINKCYTEAASSLKYTADQTKVWYCMRGNVDGNNRQYMNVVNEVLLKIVK